MYIIIKAYPEGRLRGCISPWQAPEGRGKGHKVMKKKYEEMIENKVWVKKITLAFSSISPEPEIAQYSTLPLWKGDNETFLYIYKYHSCRIITIEDREKEKSLIFSVFHLLVATSKAQQFIQF